MNGPVEQVEIIAVEKSDFAVFDFQSPERFVTDMAGRLHGMTEVELVVVVVAKHEMRRPTIEQGNNLRPADISAMDDSDRGMLFKQRESIPGCGSFPWVSLMTTMRDMVSLNL